MPSAHRESGFRFFFYSDDHLPMHIHAEKGGEVCVFLLGRIGERVNEAGDVEVFVIEAPGIRNNQGMNRADVRRALEIVRREQAKMIAKWDDHLG